MTLDNKKNLWVCHFNGACISIFNKKEKRYIKLIFQPRILQTAFGGKNNKELFVSSATKSMLKDYKNYRYSGSFFSVKTNMSGKLSKSYKIRL